MRHLSLENRRALPIVLSSFVCVFLLSASFNMELVSELFTSYPARVITNHSEPCFAEAKISKATRHAHLSTPKFAYLISGSRGDLEKLWRSLLSLYHPWNYYLVHLDLESPAEEILELAIRVERHSLFTQVGNVITNNKSNMVTYRGPTMVSNTLHACSILLHRYDDWDWFINLSASDYPLVTQDDLIHTFSHLERKLNFMEHTSDLGWKEDQRARPLIVDPGLYLSKKFDIFPVKPRRPLPTAFKLFTGSAWMILSRNFVEHCIRGWDNLPRALLMYYSNVVSSPEGYFQTVLCNTEMFVPTVVNYDMHYISWDVPPQQHPHILSLGDYENMTSSGAPFARKFDGYSSILDKIDEELLRRENGSFVRGGWCAGKPPCSNVGNPTRLLPGPGAERLQMLVDKLIHSPEFSDQQCH